MDTVCLSENANRILKEALKARGYHLIEIGRTSAVYDAIASHADIYACRICDELVVAPEQLFLIRGRLLEAGVNFVSGASTLGRQYPDNVKYNAAQVGRFLVHNTRYTEPLVLKRAEELGLTPVNVKQGYTKCSLCVVDDHSVITADRGIAAGLEKHDIDVLLIAQGHVMLPGFPYGFLGGASGRVGAEIIFNGNLAAHPDHERITDFIRSKGLRAVWFSEYPLEDIGSIIQISR